MIATVQDSVYNTFMAHSKTIDLNGASLEVGYVFDQYSEQPIYFESVCLEGVNVLFILDEKALDAIWEAVIKEHQPCLH